MEAARKETVFSFFGAGLLLGLAALARSTHLIHSLFLSACVLFWFRRNPKRAFGFTATVLAGFFLCLSPWLLRNQRRVGAPVLTSISGYSLLVAHNPHTFAAFPYRGSIDRGISEHWSGLSREEFESFHALGGNEILQSQWYSKRALDYIRNHPGETLKRGLYKILVNFLGILSPLHGPLANTAHFVSYWFLTLLALASLPKVWKTFYFQAFVALSLSQAAVSFVFWAHTSHRSFLDPMLAVLAGMGLASLLEKKPEPATI